MIHRRAFWLGLVALDVVLFVVAGIVGQHPKEQWKNVLGGIGWFGFLLVTLLLVLAGLGRLLQRRRRRVVA
jgi:hypothetical protein